MKKSLRNISGWLTKDDIQKLEEASARPFRERTDHDRWKCASCSQVFYYSSLRCPMCTGSMEKLNQ